MRGVLTTKRRSRSTYWQRTVSIAVATDELCFFSGDGNPRSSPLRIRSVEPPELREAHELAQGAVDGVAIPSRAEHGLGLFEGVDLNDDGCATEHLLSITAVAGRIQASSSQA